MIPRADIIAWQPNAPWVTDAQIEQDLVLSRAIVEIFTDPLLASELAFRGGTALHKVVFPAPARYSEDIDLVQVNAGAAGKLMTALRARLDPWLGRPRWKQNEGRVTFFYRFDSEIAPVTPLRLKVEINTREHFAVLGTRKRRFAVDNPWFSGRADVLMYEDEELLGTKLRALFQRSKGRDLFDLALALKALPSLDPAKIIACFQHYISHGKTRISRREFEENLKLKLTDDAFADDVAPLLSTSPHQPWDGNAASDAVLAFDDGVPRFHAEVAGETVRGRLLSLLP